ncbi:MAG: hypothetical protein KKA31_06035, partial [Candidatus Margulisbacteria bacterium]|nr:hypothetical protein [Candidatus Margulisiibacteriota bacterium]
MRTIKERSTTLSLLDNPKSYCQEEPLAPPDVLTGVLSDYKYVKHLIDEQIFFAVTNRFPFVATSYYCSLAEPTLNDPIMRQLCPSVEELYPGSEEEDDPLAEEASSPVPGLVHRYPDRVLMVVTNICFMNCRHCTRKRLWQYGRKACSLSEIEAMLEYIKGHS